VIRTLRAFPPFHILLPQLGLLPPPSPSTSFLSVSCRLVVIMLNFRRKKSAESKTEDSAPITVDDAPRQPFRKAIVPVIACGAGLFSDGYINNVRSFPFSPSLFTPARFRPGLGLHQSRSCQGSGVRGSKSLVCFLVLVLLNKISWPTWSRSSAPYPLCLACSMETCTRAQMPRST
jgi:hypothetical protein